MKGFGKNLLALGLGLIVVVMSLEVLWSFIQQFRVAILLVFLIGGGGYAIYRIFKAKDDDDDLSIW